MKIILKNHHIMVKEVVRKEEQKKTNVGIIIPEETLEDEQVSQGEIIESMSEEYKKGDSVFFHKTLFVDAKLRLSPESELEDYIFVKEQDVIAVITNS